jgi:hypothetical protein
MTTWEEVQQAARAAFALDRDEAHEFAITMPIGLGRAQRVMVRRYDGMDTVLVELRSAFAEAEELDPQQALDDNLHLAIGSVAQHGRYLVVVQKVALVHTTVEGILFYAIRVAQIADSLEQRQGKDRF